MRKNSLIIASIFWVCLVSGTFSTEKEMRKSFRDPDNRYRPIPFLHLNGNITKAGLTQQLNEAKQLSGFGGVGILPVTEKKQWGASKLICPGTTPEYLSEAYFARYRDILEISGQQKTEVILYDDIDFPSGSANGKFRQLHPDMTIKQLSMQEFEVRNGEKLHQTISLKGKNLGTVAMNTQTFQITDISNHVKDSTINWIAPEGSWKVMTFVMEYNITPMVDYMDPKAVDIFIGMTYDQYAKRFSSYFGHTINYTFFDDVGFYQNPHAWTESITGLYEKRTGQKALLALPALWYNIGDNTNPIRIAFFNIRADLMRDGYVRRVAEWSDKHHLQSMGHPPGNYEPSGVGAHGDVLKYYKYTQIPLMDAIHGYGYGRPGYKLVSSAADLYNRSTVAAEIYGNYDRNMDSTQMFQSAMEVFARGVNFLVPHGMWYDTTKVVIPPLISYYSKLLGPALHGYSDWAARSMTLLRGGRRVSEIAVLWPINSLEAWFGFDKRKAWVFDDVPPETDYRTISDLLTREIRRDFTFVHPEYLASNLYSIEARKLIMNNSQTRQVYNVLILPSLSVESVATLQKIKDFYDKGGKIIATGILPSKSAEFGKDKEVVAMVKSMFKIDPSNLPVIPVREVNKNEGVAVFLPMADKVSLEAILSDMELTPDVRIKEIPGLYNGVIHEANNRRNTMGMLSYIHKELNNKQIYFFANSTKKTVNTRVTLSGKLKIERWNPYTGNTTDWENVTYTKDLADHDFTSFPLQLGEVKSVFAVGDKIGN